MEKTMIELEIKGMSCMHCVKVVTDALLAVPGVEGQPEVRLEDATATVQGTPDAAVLIAAVAAAGYEARGRG
jgi:Au+-exporting ATPase